MTLWPGSIFAFYTQRPGLVEGPSSLSLACSLSEEDDEKSDSEDGDLDKQMGDLNGEEADKLDERLWGDDEEEDEDDDSKAEETGPGMDEVIKSPPPRVLAATEELVLPCPAVYCFSFCFSSLSSISLLLLFTLRAYSSLSYSSHVFLWRKEASSPSAAAPQLLAKNGRVGG